jgi:hypothetical protein
VAVTLLTGTPAANATPMLTAISATKGWNLNFSISTSRAATPTPATIS